MQEIPQFELTSYKELKVVQLNNEVIILCHIQSHTEDRKCFTTSAVINQHQPQPHRHPPSGKLRSCCQDVLNVPAREGVSEL